MATSTDTLILGGRFNDQQSPDVPQQGFWSGTLSHRYMAIPQPRLGECPSFEAVDSKNVPHSDTAFEVFTQWTSPALDGNQTFDNATVEVRLECESPLNGFFVTGVDTAVLLYIWIPSTSSLRGVIHLTHTRLSALSDSRTLTAFSVDSSGVSAVSALDGDIVVVEIGFGWTAQFAGDTNPHGPAKLYASDNGFVTFNKNHAYKDDAVSCNSGGGIVPNGTILGGAGPGGVSAPSCDNTILGG